MSGSARWWTGSASAAVAEPRGGARPAVLVTGASKGIGRACALRLVDTGFRVYAGVRTDADATSLIDNAGAEMVPVMLDILDPAQITAAAQQIDQEMGTRGLQALVNNAGVAIAGPLEFLPIDEVRRQLEINVVGQLAVTQAVLPLLRRGRQGADPDARAGRIVFMSSIAGRSTLPFTGVYSASKFALEAMADALRMELRPFGLGVSIVEPGVIDTPIWETSRRSADETARGMPPEAEQYYGRVMDALRRRIDRGMGGLPAERVADVVVHALTARRPRTRYLVGRDARLRAVLQWLLPDRARDRVVHAGMKRI